MPNITKLLSPLEELLSRLPAGSEAAQKLIAAELAARKAAQEAAYASHTLPTETGSAALEQAKKTLGKAEGGAINLDHMVSRALEINARNATERGYANGGKTRAGTKAQPFPWEEQIERTKARLKGLVTDPNQELRNISRQYFYDPKLSPEENEQKLNELAMGFAGTTVGKLPAKKASEVFGKHEGKTLMITEADRTKVGQGFLGGPGFSGLQHEYPAYKEAQAAWGVASPSKASTMVGANARVPEGQAIWAPMLGSPTQHKSNQMVFDQILNKFRRAAKAGELDPELHAKINDALASAVDKSTGNPIFPPDVDIMAKNFRSLAGTFDRRAAAADIMGGIGVGGKKGTIIDYPEIIRSTTDPIVMDSPVGSIGNRAFTLTGEVGLHPELHPAFPYILKGEDLGEVYTPIPRELALRDFVEERAAAGKKPSVWAFTRGHGPSQFISEDWLTNLQKNKYAQGGLAEGGVPEKRNVSQLFPLKVPADNAELKPQPKYPLLEKASQGVQSIHDFVSAPFGYENPAGEMVSSFLGVPAVAKTMENIAYDTPLTSGSGMTSNLRPETAEAAFAVAPLVGPAIKAGTKAGKALAPTAAEMALDIASKYGVDPRMNIIKPKGGNWLQHSIDETTSRLKTTPAATNANDELVNNWVNKKLTPYIKSEMGTESDPIRLGIERRYAEAQELRKANQKRLDKMAADIDKAKAKGKDTTLSENDLASARAKFAEEEDIAHQGLSHRTIPDGGWENANVWESEYLHDVREKAGFPRVGVSNHPAARAWENAADSEIGSRPAGDLQKPFLANTPLVQENPWINKVDPNTPIYHLDPLAENHLEFSHMIDELKEAMDPTSVLPKNLRIAPKDLEKMTVDDVSALSGKISAWRNIQKTKSDLQVANNPATHTFKEYPLDESNPKGVSWRQIKLPEGLPEEEAIKAVREATRYEGNMMRHCVGGAGHCDPLLRGEVELYTLRDAKGEPHVTIEVEDVNPNLSGEWFSYASENHPELLEKFRANQDKYKSWQDFVGKEAPQLFWDTKQRILEIKGKNNRKPNPEYIPFVQDFIKSGNWSDIADIQNTGMRATKDVFSKSELTKLKELGFKLNPVLTGEEIQTLHNAIVPEGKRLKYSPEGNIIGSEGKYAQGGAVNMAEGGVINLDNLLAQAFNKRFAEGGAAYNTTPDMSDGGQFIQGQDF